MYCKREIVAEQTFVLRQLEREGAAMQLRMSCGTKQDIVQKKSCA